MSQAKITFQSSIKDAEDLLAHFDAVNQLPPPENAEVLKRAGLVMALTAWETYVEDLATEELEFRLQSINGSQFGGFVQSRFNKDLKYFHTPNSDKTKNLFLDYFGIDVTQFWKWNNYDQQRVKKTLDDLISRRGEAVHRSKPLQAGAPMPHLVKREDLEKAIRFLKCLVEATNNAMAKQ